MRVPFGLPYELDPSEYLTGTAASARDCYRVQYGEVTHWPKRLGLESFATGLSGAVRGIYQDTAGTVIAVAGGRVYEIASTGTATAYTGTISTGTCTFAELNGKIYVGHGGTIGVVDTSAQTVSTLGGNSPSGVTHVASSKGYLLANGLISGGVAGDTNYSDDVDEDFEAADSWEVYNNEQNPDGVSALTTGWDGEVYAFGSDTVEPSYNDGTTPWATIQGATMQYGILAPYSLVMADNTLFWLTEADGARRVVKMVERVPTIVSTPYDRLLQELSTVSDAVAWVHVQRGFLFYVITFPTSDTTWAMKIDDGTWTEWGYWDDDSAAYQRYLGTCALKVDSWGKFLVGSRTGGTIYNQTGTNDAGDPIRYELTSGIVDHGTPARKRESRLIHRVKRGYGAGGSFGFRVRDNNGQWKDEKSYSLGDLGDTDVYLHKRSGGIYRGRQYQYIHAEPDSDFIFMGLDAEVGRVE